VWKEGQGACIRVLRCHKGRAKKISTENSPDVFLSAAEDGEIRQMDLRVPHTCSRSQAYGQGCPRPLMQFQMELYSLSVSKLEPWLFAVAGTSDQVYLQDRRMIPRLLKQEWGSHLDQETAALTHCVRRFGREPKEPATESEGNARRRRQVSHITSVKISETNGRDLIASYSGDGVYRFDIKGEPGVANKGATKSLAPSKRRRLSDGGSSTLQPINAEVELKWDGTRQEATDMFFPRASRSTLQPIDTENEHQWDVIRQKAIDMIFPHASNASAEVTESFESLDNDLTRLSEATQSLPGSSTFQETEASIIVLCRMLLYIKEATMNQFETVDLVLEPYKSMMIRLMNEDAKAQLLPLIEELEEANKWKAYSEEVKIRVLLWSRAEDFVKSHWKESSSASSSTSALEDQQQASRSNVGIWSVMESSEEESEEEEIDEEEMESEGSYDDQIDDEDDEEEEDEDPTLNFRDSVSSAEEQDEDRHGISRRNSPLVYPLDRYTGHSNNETVKDCGFLGSHDEYIWSGSDCGHFFIWSNDAKGELKGIWKGDGSVVNALTQHPTLPICAVSGIDETVKIFGPVSQGSRRIADAFHERQDIFRDNNRRTV
jgi:hypothetical protein